MAISEYSIKLRNNKKTAISTKYQSVDERNINRLSITVSGSAKPRPVAIRGKIEEDQQISFWDRMSIAFYEHNRDRNTHAILQSEKPQQTLDSIPSTSVVH